MVGPRTADTPNALLGRRTAGRHDGRFHCDFTFDRDAGGPGIRARLAPDEAIGGSREGTASARVGSPGVGVPGGPAARLSRNSELETAPNEDSSLSVSVLGARRRGYLVEGLRSKGHYQAWNCHISPPASESNRSVIRPQVQHRDLN